jgi:thioredoxin reductase/Pyruvate/2-oxoacid:ferredoxin oxidoreductase delta subunit
VNLLVVFGVLALLLALLLLLNNWQRKIDAVRRRSVVEQIRDAADSGTSKPFAQHPHIDVQTCIGCGSCVAACPEDGVLGMVDGVARVVHGSRCIGHGLCATACPVAAVTIGLGEVAASPDVPLLSPALEASVPGIFVAGELSGFALIRIAVEQGTRAMEEIAAQVAAEKASCAESPAADVLIVGAGPAGFAATLRAIELGLRYRTIDQEDLGGTIRKYPRRKLTLTGPLVLPVHGRVARREFLKEELVEFIEEVRDTAGMVLETGVKLLGVTGSAGAFVAQTSHGPIAARRVLLALGRRGTPRRLGVAGEETEKVLYQLVDAATYRDERILVVGGGDSAVEAAAALAVQPGNRVTLSYRRERFFRLHARNRARLEELVARGDIQPLLSSEVARIDADSVTLRVHEEGVEREVVVANDYVLVCAGGEPPRDLLRAAGLRLGNEASAVAEAARERAPA